MGWGFPMIKERRAPARMAGTVCQSGVFPLPFPVRIGEYTLS
jgi:hypothetical protein